MKIFKYLFAIVGSIILLQVLYLIWTKWKRTKIVFSGFDKTAKTIQVAVFSNDKQDKLYTIALKTGSTTTIKANDYSLKVGMLSAFGANNNNQLIGIKVQDDRGAEVAVKWLNFNDDNTLIVPQIIFEEK